MPAEELPFGQRLRQRREQVGMTRPVLAGLVGRSAEWVKAIETGRLRQPRLPILLRLAEVLGVVDLVDLTGEQSLEVAVFTRGRHPNVTAIRAAVQRYSVARPDRPPYPVAALADRMAAAWRLWHTSTDRRADVGAVLPGLLADCQDAARALEDGPGRKAVHAVLSDAYTLAQHTLVNAADLDLLWLVVDRSMAAAQIADDPLTLAGAAWTVGMMLRVGGRMDEALVLVREAGRTVEPYLPDAPDDWRGMWGALQLHAANTAARSGREGDAWAHWDRADAVSRRLPAGYAHPWTTFGAGNVALHAVSLDVDLWKSRDGLRRAGRIDPAMISSRERRGRFFVEMARGHDAAGEPVAAARYLLRACDEGTDAVRWSPAAQSIVDGLIAKPPAGARDDVRALASRIGLTA